MSRNSTVRTETVPVNDPDDLLIGQPGGVQIPEDVRNHPAWRRIWKKLLSPPPASKSTGERAA